MVRAKASEKVHNRTVQIGHIKRELSPSYDKHPDNEGVGVEGLLLLSVLKKKKKKINTPPPKKKGGGEGGYQYGSTSFNTRPLSVQVLH